MSNVSIAHTVTPFDSKKSQALTGQRLAKVGYKSSKTSPAKFPSVCASVPPIEGNDIRASMDQLVPHIREFLSGVQDQVIRSLYESSGGLLGQVLDTEISIESCVKFLEAEATGGRLSGEFLKSWFDENVCETVQVLVAEKLKYGQNDQALTEEQEFTVGKHCNAYRDLIASLAGGKTMLQPVQIKSLLNVLSLVSEDDTSGKLVSRLNKMLEAPKRIEELLEL